MIITNAEQILWRRLPWVFNLSCSAYLHGGCIDCRLFHGWVVARPWRPRSRLGVGQSTVAPPPTLRPGRRPQDRHAPERPTRSSVRPASPAALVPPSIGRATVLAIWRRCRSCKIYQRLIDWFPADRQTHVHVRVSRPHPVCYCDLTFKADETVSPCRQMIDLTWPICPWPRRAQSWMELGGERAGDGSISFALERWRLSATTDAPGVTHDVISHHIAKPPQKCPSMGARRNFSRSSSPYSHIFRPTILLHYFYTSPTVYLIFCFTTADT